MGTPNRFTHAVAELLSQERLKARADAPDGPEMLPLEIIRRVANRLYAKAVAARARGDYPLEEQLLKLAASAAEKAAPYTSPKMPAMVVGPNDLPSLKRLTIKQLQQLLADLEGEYTDITDQEESSQGHTRRLEGPQAPPPSGPSNGSRPRR